MSSRSTLAITSSPPRAPGRSLLCISCSPAMKLSTSSSQFMSPASFGPIKANEMQPEGCGVADGPMRTEELER